MVEEMDANPTSRTTPYLEGEMGEVLWQSRDAAQKSFAELYKPDGMMSVKQEDGSVSSYSLYRIPVDPQSAERQVLSDFMIRAACAGYTPALGPIVLPNTGYYTNDVKRERPISQIMFCLQKPSSPLSSTGTSHSPQGK